MGEKQFFICTPGVHSVNFEQRFQFVEYYMKFIERGPKNDQEKQAVKFYNPEQELLLCQPSLSAQAVITSTAGISMVWGWEDSNNNSLRVERTLRSYGSGLPFNKPS